MVEYAEWLGMDKDKDQAFFWIARDGLKAKLPKDWKPCKAPGTDDVYYFNFKTGASTWDHPCDDYYRNIFIEEKKKRKDPKVETNLKSKEHKKTSKKAVRGDSSVFLAMRYFLTAFLVSQFLCDTRSP